MNRRTIINGVALLAIVIVVGAAAWLKGGRQVADTVVANTEVAASASDATEVEQGVPFSPAESAGGALAAAPGSAPGTTGLPRMIDLGAKKCIPCKRMAPILEELEAEYAGRAEIIFIDVWLNPEAGKQYGLRLIPTQIFYDREGNEVWRHEGFLAKEDIVARLTELEE